MTEAPARRGRSRLLAPLAVWGATRLLLVAVALVGPPAAFGVRRGFLPSWENWDVDLFRKVAQFGYDGLGTDYDDAGVEAFFPGFPLVLRAVHGIVPDWTAAGLLVSLVAGAVAAVFLARLAELDGTPGWLAVLVLTVSPYAVFLAAGYSESLWLALALPGWWCARQGRWALASALVAGACVVRVSGLFLAVGLVVAHLVARRGVRRDTAWLLLPFAAVAGYAGYLAWLTGDPLRWLHAQEEGWDRRLSSPWAALQTTWRLAGDTGLPPEYGVNAVVEIGAVAVGVLLTVALLRRRDWGEATYVGLSVTALATSTYYLSVARTALLWFPLWLILAEQAQRRRWVLPAYLALALPSMVAVATVWLSSRWVG